MSTLFKSLLIICGHLLSTHAVATEVKKPLINSQHSVHSHNNHPHNEARVQGRSHSMFLTTPLDERTHINSPFGYRIHPISGKWAGHQGLDYPAPESTPIRATAQGTISFIGVQNGYGNVIFIKHDNDYSTVYAHQSRFKRGLKKGSFVGKGQVIGYVGSTGTSSGPHLHYELRVNNQPVDPIQMKRRLASYAQK